MQFGWSLLHHCSSQPGMQACEAPEPETELTGAHRIVRGYANPVFLEWNHLIEGASDRQAWGCLPGTGGLQQVHPFSCGGPRCLFFLRPGQRLSQLPFRENRLNSHDRRLMFLVPHKVRVMELILSDRRGAGRLQECSPNSFCKTDRRFTLLSFPSQTRISRQPGAPAGFQYAERAPKARQRPAGRDGAG